MPKERLTGTLIRLRDEGYGFIHVQHGEQHYVNISSLRDRADWQEGLEVSFVSGEPRPGKARPAYDVVAVTKV